MRTHNPYHPVPAFPGLWQRPKLPNPPLWSSRRKVTPKHARRTQKRGYTAGRASHLLADLTSTGKSRPREGNVVPKVTQEWASIRTYLWDPPEMMYPSCPRPTLSPGLLPTPMPIDCIGWEKGMKLQKETACSFSLSECTQRLRASM